MTRQELQNQYQEITNQILTLQQQQQEIFKQIINYVETASETIETVEGKEEIEETAEVKETKVKTTKTKKVPEYNYTKMTFENFDELYDYVTTQEFLSKSIKVNGSFYEHERGDDLTIVFAEEDKNPSYRKNYLAKIRKQNKKYIEEKATSSTKTELVLSYFIYKGLTKEDISKYLWKVKTGRLCVNKYYDFFAFVAKNEGLYTIDDFDYDTTKQYQVIDFQQKFVKENYPKVIINQLESFYQQAVEGLKNN